MSQETAHDRFYKTACRHDRENWKERRIRRDGEPIICSLTAGENRLNRDDFKSAARYLLEGETLLRAHRQGRFSVGAIQCVRCTDV